MSALVQMIYGVAGLTHRALVPGEDGAVMAATLHDVTRGNC